MWRYRRDSHLICHKSAHSQRGLLEHCRCIPLLNLLNSRQENVMVWLLSKKEFNLDRDLDRTPMEISVLNLPAHIWKYIKISVLVWFFYRMQQLHARWLIFLLNFCFATEFLQWISSKTLRKLFIWNLSHHMGKRNRYLEMWERVYLLSGNQLVNGDKNLNKRNKAIIGKSSLVTDQCALDTSPSASTTTQHWEWLKSL